MKKNHFFKLSILPIIATYLTSCGNFLGDDFLGGNDKWYGFETEILRVDIDPNPVVSGNPVTFRCVIKDSLDTSFYFLWIAIKDSTSQTRTESNTYTVEAPDIPGNYVGNVYVSNDRPNYGAVSEDFTYEVIEKPN